MDSVQMILSVLQLLVLGVLLVVTTNLRRRVRRHERVSDKLLQRQKRLRTKLDGVEAKLVRRRGAQEVGGLHGVHRALADQITHAGEHLDRRMGVIEAKLDGAGGGLVGAGADAARGTEEPLPDAEVRIARSRIHSAPERNLNLVHAIQKTGNSSLLATLWASKPLVDCAMSAHFYSAQAIDDLQQIANHALNEKLRQGAGHQYKRALATREFLGGLGYLADWPGYESMPVPACKLNVVCAFRDPVAGAMSLRYYMKSCGGPRDAAEAMQARRKCPKVPLAREYPFHPTEYLKWMEKWAHHELLALYGVRLQDVMMDHEKGYGIHETDRVRLLVLTTESFANLDRALADFYHAEPAAVTLIKANEGESRKDAQEYREAVMCYKASRRMLDELYAAPILRHLYSESQLDGFKRKWCADNSAGC